MKYIAKAIKSLVVVINGPDAKAGLKLSLSKIMGVIVPSKEDNITIENKETDTIRAVFE
jgi:hypothetical protein